MRIGKPRHREEEHHPFSGAKITTTDPFDGGALTARGTRDRRRGRQGRSLSVHLGRRRAAVASLSLCGEVVDGDSKKKRRGKECSGGAVARCRRRRPAEPRPGCITDRARRQIGDRLLSLSLSLPQEAHAKRKRGREESSRERWLSAPSLVAGGRPSTVAAR